VNRPTRTSECFYVTLCLFVISLTTFSVVHMLISSHSRMIVYNELERILKEDFME
jgi:hypothetical protein